MKYILALMMVMAMALPATAAFKGPGATGVTTVSAALNAADDTRCTLEGYIVEQAGNDDDEFLFRDSTGTIKVDIDDKVFGGRTVTPQMKVRLTGEVDKHMLRDNTVDVDYLEIIE